MDEQDQVERRRGRGRQMLYVFIPLGFAILVGIFVLSGIFISEDADRGPNDVPLDIPEENGPVERPGE